MQMKMEMEARLLHKLLGIERKKDIAEKSNVFCYVEEARGRTLCFLECVVQVDLHGV